MEEGRWSEGHPRGPYGKNDQPVAETTAGQCSWDVVGGGRGGGIEL